MEKPVGWAPELMAIASSGASFLYLNRGRVYFYRHAPYLLEPDTTLRLLLPLLIHYIALVLVV